MGKQTITITALSIVFILLLVFPLVLGATRTFYVEETDFVKIQPEIKDLDYDKVNVTYSKPLDEKGEWQTTYDDAGEYEITITATDGKDKTVETVKLIVTEKNQAPLVTEKSIQVKETQLVDLKDLVEDPEGDVLSFKFTPPFNSQGEWLTDYNDAGKYVVKFSVSDGQFTIPAQVEVIVLNTNQAPTIVNSFSEEAIVTILEDERLGYNVTALDKDNNTIYYEWRLDGQNISAQPSGEYYFDYESAGKHMLDVVISDGTKNSSKQWLINVQNKNRKPTLEIPEIVVKEGETVTLSLLETDIDGDVLAYGFEKPLDSKGIWQTTYDDAGVYSLDVTASDGDFTSKATVKITVVDMDRAPTMNLPGQLEVWEEENLTLVLEVVDQDGDNISLQVANLPEFAQINSKTKALNVHPTFDAIRRGGGMISNILNSLRLEKYFLQKKKYELLVNACGKELCSNGTIALTLYNVNRKPLLQNLGNVSVEETEKVKVVPSAFDPDGDIVRYYYTSPLKKRAGTWETTYDDAGEYVAFVTATDGDWGDTKPVAIEVSEKNRPPTIIVPDDVMVVSEGQPVSFAVSAVDEDNDDLLLTLKDLPFGASFSEGTFSWTAPYNSVVNKTPTLWSKISSRSTFFNKKFNKEQASLWLEFAASDNKTEVVHPVQIIIKNTNQPPILEEVTSLENLTLKTQQPILFTVKAGDKDNDKLTYKWVFGLKDPVVEGTNTIERTFLTPGQKEVRVEISDGRETIEYEWRFMVAEQPYVPPLVVAPPAIYKFYVIEG